MVDYAIGEVADSPIGARLLTVDVAQTNDAALRFWRNKGFVFADTINAGRRDLFGYLDLHSEINT